MGNLSITATDVAAVEIIEQFTGPASEAITAGQYVRFNTSTGKIEPGNGSSSGERGYQAGIALRSAAAGVSLTVLRKGIVDLGNALGDLDYDAPVYLSDTDGTLATSTGSVERIVGYVTPIWVHTTADKALRVDL